MESPPRAEPDHRPEPSPQCPAGEQDLITKRAISVDVRDDVQALAGLAGAPLIAKQPDPRLGQESLGAGPERQDAGDGWQELTPAWREQTPCQECVVGSLIASDRAKEPVDEVWVEIVASSPGNRRPVEERPALVIAELRGLHRSQAPVLVANSKEDLAAHVLVHVLARIDFDDQEVIGVAALVDAGHDLEVGGHRRASEVAAGLAPPVVQSLVRARALDGAAPDADHDQATFGVRQRDHRVGEVTGLHAGTLAIEPLAFGALPQRRHAPVFGEELELLDRREP
jgi:hypothetical protein